jgi:hypothetical protein
VYVGRAGVASGANGTGGGEHAETAILSTISTSPKRLQDDVEEKVLAPSRKRGATPAGYTMAVFSTGSQESRDYAVLLTYVTAALVKNLNDREIKSKTFHLARMTVYEIVLALVAGLTAFRFGWRFAVSPEAHETTPSCKRTVALMNNMDPEDSQGLEDGLRDTRNHKLRADYYKCEHHMGMETTRDKLSVGAKFVMLVLVVLLLIAAIRSHFVDLKRVWQDDLDALKTMSEVLPNIARGLDGSNDTERNGIDTTLDKLIVTRDNCNLLRGGDGGLHTRPMLGRAAKYALASAFALTAVLVSVQSARPGTQVQRLKELRPWAGGGGDLVSGGGEAPNRDDLVRELEMLKAGTNPVEIQIVTLCVLLAASGYACMALVAEVVTVSA